MVATSTAPSGSSVATEVEWTTSKPGRALSTPRSQARVISGPGSGELWSGNPSAASGSGPPRAGGGRLASSSMSGISPGSRACRPWSRPCT